MTHPVLGPERVAELAPRGADDVLVCRTDVSRLDQVERLRDQAIERFGEVGLLMNNAAGFFLGRAYRDLEAWQRTFATNLMGVVHGLHAFESFEP